MKTNFLAVIFLFAISRIYGNYPNDSTYNKSATFWIRGSCALDLNMISGELMMYQERIVFISDKNKLIFKPIVIAIDSNLAFCNKVSPGFLLTTSDSVSLYFTSYAKWKIRDAIPNQSKNVKNRKLSYKPKENYNTIGLSVDTWGSFLGVSRFVSQGSYEISNRVFNYTNLQHPYLVNNISFNLEDIIFIRKGFFTSNVKSKLQNSEKYRFKIKDRNAFIKSLTN